ncbi:gustatory receptor for sugar taste 64a-like [Condylostylus longicornis]|uniref:gustatory receptor for sugar taste 64a-like n=1 Tax=Condylostylus longicornis TaxID=2530218 RepID=UPI00244DC40F|nr:gustatory receptor for sugar taste 64a-like [Condylostylus longicornis]
MMISMGITARFQQFNHRLEKMVKEIIPIYLWNDVRKDYNQLVELLEYLDEKISWIVLLSFMNNLYFICIQVLNIFTKLKFIINYIYFWFSLSYLICRTLFIFMCAASINDQAVLPLKLLRNVPSESWNTEVERLIFDQTNTILGLSGKKFFYITRKLLFNLTGSLITYELVLLQFETTNLSHSQGICD